MEDKDKELAMALVRKFTFASIYFTDGDNGAKRNARECAKIDLQHSIELLEEVEINTVSDYGGYIDRKLQSLRNQLEHLNSI